MTNGRLMSGPPRLASAVACLAPAGFEPASKLLKVRGELGQRSRVQGVLGERVSDLFRWRLNRHVVELDQFLNDLAEGGYRGLESPNGLGFRSSP